MLSNYDAMSLALMRHSLQGSLADYTVPRLSTAVRWGDP